MPDKRTATINARVTQENKDFLNNFSNQLGVSSSRLLEWLIEVLKDANQQQKQLKEVN